MFSILRGTRATSLALAGMALASLLSVPLRAADPDFITAVTTTNPVAFYQLNATSGKSEVGSTTYKSQGGATASNTGGPLATPNSGFVKLDGHDGWIVTTQSGGVGLAASIMCWVNLDTLPSQENHIFYVAGESQNGNDLDLQIENDNALRFFTASGGNLAFKPPADSLLHQWHMVVATINTATQARTIYWDGKVASSDKGGGRAGKTGVFSIGASTVFSGRYLKGGVADAALWNRALTAAEVASIYAAGKSTSGAAAISSAAAPGRSMGSGGGSSSAAGGITTKAKVEVGTTDAPVPLKPAEQVAVLFLTSIQQIEMNCQDSAKKACTLDQLLAGTKGGKLKIDPRTDPNYTYDLAINGAAWEAHATPKKPGLAAFYSYSKSFPTSEMHYNADGKIASPISTELGNRSVEGNDFIAF